jgi:dTDP-4-amino-4,6-dideoxygalactose transaminase
MKAIPFSPPDITRMEIKEVVRTLKSGWITTGPRTKKFEKEIAEYCSCEKVIALNSCTAGLELVLRLFDIGKGDEVITTPYTFAATANVIIHLGAKPVFADIKKDEFNIDPDEIKKAINKKTKAVIVVDFGGWPCDYDEIKNALNEKKKLFRPEIGTLQKKLDRTLLISDAAHAFGAGYGSKKLGSAADFTAFSFHAVKNLTTAEGGAVAFNSLKRLRADDIYKNLALLSLHGQSKDALSKLQAGSWKYSIELAGYKCNMTDIQAAIGLVQLKRYDEMLKKRKRLFELYEKNLNNTRCILPPFNENLKADKKINSYHLFPLRIKGIGEKERDKIIEMLSEKGIPANVHFIPLPLHKFYKNSGYDIKDYPNTYEMYKNEITLPLYSALKEKDVIYICRNLNIILQDNI